MYQLEFDKGLPTLRTRFRPLCESDFLVFDHMTTDRLLKLYFVSAAISKQLNAAPYLCDVHEPSPQPRGETTFMPRLLFAQRENSLVNCRFGSSILKSPRVTSRQLDSEFKSALVTVNS